MVRQVVRVQLPVSTWSSSLTTELINDLSKLVFSSTPNIFLNTTSTYGSTVSASIFEKIPVFTRSSGYAIGIYRGD